MYDLCLPTMFLAWIEFFHEIWNKSFYALTDVLPSNTKTKNGRCFVIGEDMIQITDF